MTAPQGFAPHRIYWLLLGLVAALGLVVAGVLTNSHATRLFLDDTARRGDNTLQLAVTSLHGQLARYERLPQLLADHALIRRIAETPDDPALVVETNAYLKATSLLLGASDIYFMDPSGTTRAASNHDSDTSFIGGNFAFRPYFYDAISGGTGRFFALGTTSRKRGYYFGAPVRVGADIRGVLVFKIDLDAIEDAWRGGDYELIVTDPEGVVFLSSRKDWLFSAISPLTPAQQDRLAETRRYADAVVQDFPLTGRAQQDGHSLMTVAEGTVARAFLVREQLMPDAGWTISVLLDTTSARRQALTVAIVVVLGLGLGMMVGAVVLQRRARLRERLELQQAARAGLEARVAERTSELATVNRQLEAEVAERRSAEQNLRQAQSDLVQAGKLAALGQMSAALSHEFNQPLGATRTYADNALVLIERGRLPEARDNISRILALIDRMTAISRHLRSFARKPGQRLEPVSLSEVIEAAQEIAGLRLSAADASLSVTIPDDLPQVIAGPVRLQQVLVNILTNAADAVEGHADRRIELAAHPTAEGVRLTIRDHGPGVPPALGERIFDPFFSTKGVGKGLGLGLSISYNIIKDFGGALRVAAAPGGGAEFSLDLRCPGAADAPEQAA